MWIAPLLAGRIWAELVVSQVVSGQSCTSLAAAGLHLRLDRLPGAKVCDLNGRRTLCALLWR